MKVLFVQDTYFYTNNNNQYYSEHIDNSILDRYLHLGNHVTFLGRETNIYNEEFLKKFTPLDNTKCDVITLPSIRSRKGYFKNLKIVKQRIEEAVKKNDIIMPRIPSAYGSLAVKYAKKHKKALIGEVVGCTWDGYWNYNFKGKVIAPYFFFKQKQVVKKLPYAIYVTENFLQRRYPMNGKSTFCSNVVIESVSEEILDKRLKKIQNIKENDIINIGTIAGLDVPFKGQKYVIEAISKKKSDKYVYKVVGNGTGKKLRKFANKLNVKDKFIVVGPIKHDEIFNFLDGIDLYIQPSKQEGLPRALIEAMSRGLPAIGSRTGGIPELLNEEFIFNKGNSDQLLKIILDFNIIKMKKEANINFLKSKEYSLESINKRRFDFYCKFLEDNNLPLSSKLKNIL